MKKINFSLHPNLFSCLAGALAVLALPPINILPAMFLSLAALVYFIAHAENKKQAFWRGWFWGLGYFVMGLYWINVALTVDWPRFAWLIPLCALGLPSVLAIYIGFTGLATHVVARRFQKNKVAAILLFPLFWTEFEIIRGWALTGFPWNSIGISFIDFAPLLQSASIIGMYGLGFVIAASVALWVASYELSKLKIALRGAAAAILIIIASFGFYRLNYMDMGGETLRLRLVQPNVPQNEKWDTAHREGNLKKLLTLTAHGSPVDLVVWPEAAVPYILSETPGVRTVIARALPPQAMLATGAIRRDENGQLYNSVEYVNWHGEITGHYDKSHLVPFGEYVPFGKYIPLPVVTAFSGLGRGDGPQTQNLGDLRISPMICYEIIFPGEVAVENAQLIINVTNDAWYGDTIGPHQHLAQARMRAVEEGITVARAANTGISAVIDRYGRVITSLPFDKMGAVDAKVQIPAEAPPPAAHKGFYLYLFGLMACYLLVVIACLRTTTKA